MNNHLRCTGKKTSSRYAIATLQELQQAYPGADIYINGELTVDFPEDVKIPIEQNQMVTAELVGNRIKFSYCSLDRSIALLREQYAVGTVEVRIVPSSSKSNGNIIRGFTN